jgi:hypothetical protein
MAKDNMDVLNKLFFSDTPKPQPAPQPREEEKSDEEIMKYMETTRMCYDHKALLQAGDILVNQGCLWQEYRCLMDGCPRKIYAKLKNDF